MDENLWKLKNYREFLQARKELLAEEANRCLERLLHGETQWLEGAASPLAAPPVPGGVSSEEEEEHLEALNAWVLQQGLPRGEISYDFADPTSGEQRAVFDLAWPNGVQEELSSPVAVLLNEGAEVLAVAGQAGYRCFTTAEDFKRYIEEEILATAGATTP
jgi:hypothetical protein